MNRRDFLRLAGIAALGFLAPKKAGTMLPNSTNRYGDMLREFYDGMKNNSLSDTRLAEIVRVFNELSERENIYKSWVDIGEKVKSNRISFPIEPIFSQVLENNKTELLFDPVPSTYNHLLFIGSARSTSTGTGNEFLNAELNGDAGLNYTVQSLTSVATTTTSDNTYYNNIYFPIGFMVGNGQAAGKPGSFFSIMPYYTGSFYKTALTFIGYSTGSNYGVAIQHCQWFNTSPITKVRLWGSANSILAGSIISVYGIK